MEIYTLAKSEFKINDDKFSVDLIGQYNLYVLIGKVAIEICIVDSSKDRCVWVERTLLTSYYHISQLIDQLQKIMDRHQVLRAGYWKNIFFGTRNTNFTLIPSSLFDPENALEYLQLSNNIELDKYEVSYHTHKKHDLVNIFAYPKELLEWLDAIYPTKKIKYMHHTSALIEGVLNVKSNFTEPMIYVSVGGELVTIIALDKERELIYCNTFQYNSPDDLAYFVLFVVNELELDPNKTPTIVYGDIHHDSPELLKLASYIRNVYTGDSVTHLHLSYHFDEIAEHQLFNLYNMHLCS